MLEKNGDDLGLFINLILKGINTTSSSNSSSLVRPLGEIPVQFLSATIVN